MTTPAGWYPDPSGKPGQRFWDGQQWTTTAPPSDSGERRFTIHYGFAVLAILSLLATLFLGIPLFATAIGSDDQSAQGVGMGMSIMWLLWGLMWTGIWSAFAINHTLKSRR